MPVQVPILILALIVGFLVYWAIQRRRAFRVAGEKLGLADLRVDGDSFSGDVRGMHVNHYEQRRRRGRWTRSPALTQIDVTFAPSELVLELRRRKVVESQAAARGEAVELETGDAAFDETWIVEGAPAARALDVLSHPWRRSQLRAFGQLAEARVIVDDGIVTLFRYGNDMTDDVVDLAHTELALDLAQACAAASTKELPVEAPTRAEADAAASYRAAPPRPEGQAAAHEIASLKARRAERRADERFAAARPLIALGHLVAPALVAAGLLEMSDVIGAPERVAVIGLVGQMLATLATAVMMVFLRKAGAKAALGEAGTVMIVGWVVLLVIVVRLFVG